MEELHPKERSRIRLEKDIAKFLERGGKIKQIPNQTVLELKTAGVKRLKYGVRGIQYGS